LNGTTDLSHLASRDEGIELLGSVRATTTSCSLSEAVVLSGVRRECTDRGSIDLVVAHSWVIVITWAPGICWASDALVLSSLSVLAVSTEAWTDVHILVRVGVHVSWHWVAVHGTRSSVEASSASGLPASIRHWALVAGLAKCASCGTCGRVVTSWTELRCGKAMVTGVTFRTLFLIGHRVRILVVSR
jgi:hypothetical protein